MLEQDNKYDNVNTMSKLLNLKTKVETYFFRNFLKSV